MRRGRRSGNKHTFNIVRLSVFSFVHPVKDLRAVTKDGKDGEGDRQANRHWHSGLSFNLHFFPSKVFRVVTKEAGKGGVEESEQEKRQAFGGVFLSPRSPLLLSQTSRGEHQVPSKT